MPDLPISGLTAGNPAQSADLIPIDRSGSTFNVTAGSIANLSGVTFGVTGPSWWGSYDGGLYGFSTAINGQYGTGTANQVKWAMWRLPYTIQISKLAMLRNGSPTAAVVGFGVYTATGNKIFSWDNISINTTGLANTVLGSPVTLQPAVYISATACSTISNNATQNGYQSGSTSEGIEPWSANGTIRSGTAANAMSAGAMPATLGALSLGGGGFGTMPYYIMEA